MVDEKKPIPRLTAPARPAKKPLPNKHVVAAPKKKEPAPKLVVEKEIPDTTEDENAIEEAPAPADLKTAGWKNKLAAKKAVLLPKVLKTKAETWDKKKAEKSTGKKRTKGLLIIIDGLRKSGKTHTANTAVDFEGYEGRKRIIPRGNPVYILDTEDAVEDEVGMNFEKQYDDDQIIVNVVLEKDPFTKEIDPLKSMANIEEWAYALSDDVEGTLVIDSFTDYCKWANWKLEELKNADHNPIGKASRVNKYDYGWLYKRVDTFLRALRLMKINVILIARVKDEWVNPTPSDPYAGYKTGGFLTDAIKGFDSWVDVICRYEKDKFDDHVERRLIVTDSRFETVDMKNRKYVLEGNPTFSDLIDLFKDLI